MKKYSKKKAEAHIQKLYSTYFNCVQINMMDIPKVWRDIEHMVEVQDLYGGDIDPLMHLLVKKYQVEARI